MANLNTFVHKFKHIEKMMKIRMLLMLICLIAFSAESFAQRKRGAKKKETEKSTVIIFDDEKEEDDDDERINSSRATIIKTSPISFIFGNQIIEVEKEINDWFSLQLGAGVTFKDRSKDIDFLAEIIDEESDGEYGPFSDVWESDELDFYYDGTRQSKLGYAFTFSPRLFYGSDGCEGGYIAPTLTYKKFAFKAEDVVLGNNYVERTGVFTDSESVGYLDFTVRYGQTNFFEKLTTESFVGLGIRSISNHRQDLGYTTGGYLAKGFQDFKSSELRLELGVRIGFQL